jgi:BolA family transcriptional regulator, general stress-responsive regulator
MGESNFMTGYYADDTWWPASLTDPYDVISTAFLMRPTAIPQVVRNQWQAMRVQETITRKLTEAFSPESIRVVDESDRHAGHAGHRAGGESHFRVYIVSQAFKGKSRLERHRMINQTLTGEFASGVHALAIHASAPGEDAA